MASGFRNSAGVDTDDIYDSDVVGDGPVASFMRRADGSALRYAAAKYGTPGAPLGFRDAGGNDMGPQWARKGTASYALPINGQQYSSGVTIKATSSAAATIGFRILNGNTWDVFRSNTYLAATSITSGAIPANATGVRFTWVSYVIDGGASQPDAGGGTTNQAAGNTPVSSNPVAAYTTNSWGPMSGSRGRTYTFRVEFFNGSGNVISDSTIYLSATTEGSV